MNNEELKWFYDDNYTVLMNTKLLFINSLNPNLFNAHLLLRYYVVESYLKKQNCEQAFKLYNEMQKKRVEFKPVIPKEKAGNELVFKNLIESIKKNGFDNKYPIQINKKLKLVNGSHRLAIALYLGIEKVPVVITPESENIDSLYDVNWFLSNNMKPQADIILKTYEKLLNNGTLQIKLQT